MGTLVIGKPTCLSVLNECIHDGVTTDIRAWGCSPCINALMASPLTNEMYDAYQCEKSDFWQERNA